MAGVDFGETVVVGRTVVPALVPEPTVVVGTGDVRCTVVDEPEPGVVVPADEPEPGVVVGRIVTPGEVPDVGEVGTEVDGVCVVGTVAVVPE